LNEAGTQANKAGTQAGDSRAHKTTETNQQEAEGSINPALLPFPQAQVGV
jgi:hypothetical protein